ncbi:hypothetical protein E1B28_003050 [Marasmius oreades]|uniref:Uncharacterized protein n=1 Tax=Marasmius oreades TaxID=181124 RepID=A0A9P7UJ40_9AGAR|nr:uncharacterized protein E1B28_003050 [Marasmius oreades]KAG7085487.1 hypothetical protein E1B28_003050 [Marasmius oreades]
MAFHQIPTTTPLSSSFTALAMHLNLRIVLLERPPYRSTPYTESELDDLKQDRKIYLDRFGAHLTMGFRRRNRSVVGF